LTLNPPHDWAALTFESRKNPFSRRCLDATHPCTGRRERTHDQTHVASILQKLDLRNRVQAVVLAYESGLINPSEGSEPNSRLGG
jgi:hypothetical protein